MGKQFEALAGARKIFDPSVDLVQTSCGMGVPYYSCAVDLLKDWAVKKGRSRAAEILDGKEPNQHR